MYSNKENNFQKEPKKQNIPRNLLLSEGNKYLRLSQFEKAISCYEIILQQNANHIQSLLGKAKCYMKLGRYSEAWTNLDKLLNLNPKCTEAINLKGTAEYFVGNFEKSFSTYWHGYKIQPFCDYLRQGYQLCKKTIDNSLNAEVRMLLTEKDVGNLSNLFLKASDKDDKDASSTNYDKKGQYSADLKLLDDICKDKELTTLYSPCAQLFKYLKGRQKFRKMQENHKTINKSNNFVINNIFDAVQINKLVRNFGLCRLALYEKKTSMCVNKGNEILKLLKSIKGDFPERKEVEAEALHYFVMAHLIEEDFETALKYCTQLQSIAKEKASPNLKGIALRDFGEVFYKSKKYKESLNCFLKSLQFTEWEQQKSEILYKIADCHVHLNKLKDAKIAAEKCLDLVIKNENLRFQFDILLLLAEIGVKTREMKGAEEHYRDALEIAIQNNDTRKTDLIHLLDIFEEINTKDSDSTERMEIIKITGNMNIPK